MSNLYNEQFINQMIFELNNCSKNNTNPNFEFILFVYCILPIFKIKYFENNQYNLFFFLRKYVNIIFFL